MQKPNLLVRVNNAIALRVAKIVHRAKDSYYRVKNRNKPRLFVFTDSRGYEVVKPWNRKSAYASYVGKLCEEYHVEYVICPEFSTTVIDFLYEYQQRIKAGKHYDAVIAHVGVVDYSPRPVSMLADMMLAKQHKIDVLFSGSTFDFEKYHQNSFEDLYFGKPVKNFYSIDFLKTYLLPELKAIDNLVMVGCTPVLSNWHGNYWRERPANMNMILDYSAICQEQIEHFIDYSSWTEDNIKTNTIDNIHLSTAGFDVVLEDITRQLRKLGFQQE
jgi:hypothetical protein